MALLSVADALERVLAKTAALPAETIPLADAYMRILAADLKALRTQPPADLSAMDGYAVRGSDVAAAPARLKVVGEVSAGRPFDRSIAPGEAARIFTGGVMPEGTDTVVIQEVTACEDDVVVVNKPTKLGKNVRKAALDFAEGQTLLTVGRCLGARDLALAAGMNHATVSVYRRPRVAILATGDELIPPGTAPGPGQIVYSNGYALAAFAKAEGADVIDLGIAPDRLNDTVAAIRRAREAKVDILLTSGGASVGDYDFVQKALSAEGIALSFWRVALRPGRPLMHGRLGAMHVLGLPGNPVSAYVCAALFLVPLLRSLSGRRDLTLTTESATLGTDLPANDERTDYLRAQLENGVANPFPAQDSSMMLNLAIADCLIVREPLAPPAKVGTRCTIVKLPL
ncbi:MAG: molybdopterin molybdotransferase MoeA [Rhizobiales bacterium]|nr:molybdopterin molybdotransferase MoeA [Hyphomicrobiales bacterium]